MEFEHVLAGCNGREYVQRRFVVSRFACGLRGPHEKVPRGRFRRILHPNWQGEIEKSIQLPGLIFQIRLRSPARIDVGQDMSSAKGHAECNESRQKLPIFLQVSKGSILMLMASKEWYTQKQQAGVTCPLRQVLFLKGIEELVHRIGRLSPENSEDVLCANLRAKQILTEQNA